MARLRAQYGNCCHICGERLQTGDTKKINLQFAHCKPTELKGHSRGRKERIADIRRHPNHYRLLCIDCHQELDALMGDPNEKEG